MDSLVPYGRSDVIRQISEHALLEASDLIQDITRKEIRISLVSLGEASLLHCAREMEDPAGRQVVIRQNLLGGIDNGFAAMFIARACAQDLVRELLGERAWSIDMTSQEEGVLCEIANILINSCLDNFSEVNNERCGSDLPRIDQAWLSSLVDEADRNPSATPGFRVVCIRAEVFGTTRSCPFHLVFPRHFAA
jgi:chemotaxis protein CheY-P-specific phosphatase CheC